jgi:uncharacterized protein (DUF433 family)
MNVGDYITTDPRICHGKPCFKGTRILVHLVLELLAEGISKEEITSAKYYPELTPQHIKAALEYAAEISKAGEMLELHA